MAYSRPRRTSPPRPHLASAMREVHRNVPSTVRRANVSGARREKMLRAVAYAKARRRQG